MAASYTVKLSSIIKELSLKEIYIPRPTDEILVKSADINKPGLQFMGEYRYFDADRIQVFGLSEVECLRSFSAEKRHAVIDELFSYNIPAMIVTRDLDIEDFVINEAKEHKIAVLSTEENTSTFMAALIAFLNVALAPRCTQHGVLVEVYGEGILILGESGVGKSETAIELIKRGHRLIADDAVEIRRVSNKSLVGSAPENIRYFIELRGIGIINARRIFGMGAIKQTEKIDFVLKLELWDPNKVYDRMGLENEKTDILGIDVPSITVPIKPGRNTASIIEVAAMNNRQKKMGYNAAEELLERLGLDQGDAEKISEDSRGDWSKF
ncbi:MAG: HPr(Ser) kinase/phosphatase [Acutalibacteraceae bacterium]